jgi:hypothetical protein
MRWLAMSVLVLGVTTTAWAQEGREPRPEGPNFDRFFKALDKNGDGKIDRQELEGRLPELMARWREARGPEGDRPEGPRREMAERMREKAKERRGEAERSEEAKRPGAGRSEGPPREMAERLERLVEAKVNEALERKAPEIARHIRDLVAKDMREIMERRAPEMMHRIQELVDRKVGEACERAAREFPKGPRPPVPPAGEYRPGPERPRAFMPPCEKRGWEGPPEFGLPRGMPGRDGWAGPMRKPWWHDDGCRCPECKRLWERKVRPWGPPGRGERFGEFGKLRPHGDGCTCPECKPSRERGSREWKPAGRGWDDDGPRWDGPRARERHEREDD